MRAPRIPYSRWAAGLILISLLLFLGGSSGASSAPKNYDPGGKRFERLGHNLICMCGCGQILLECNHVGCATSDHMRKELKAAIDSGESDQQIMNGFVAEYGPVVLASPTTSGFNRVAWIMPIVIFFAGLGGVTLVVRAWKRIPNPPSDSTASASGALDEFRRRAREETDL